MESRWRASGALSRYAFWALLAVPAVPVLASLAVGTADAESLLQPSGEFAARFLIVALMITPLRLLLPATRWLEWLARRRRAIGVAAFAYAALHTGLYVVDMGTLRTMLAELFALGIWTGWVAFGLMLVLGLTSNDASVRALGRRWKTVHRCAYAAAVLTLVHWLVIHDSATVALVHFAPLALLAVYRLYQLARSPLGLRR